MGNLAAGFRGGTYDVVVEDRFDEDVEVFASTYPALRNFKIEKNIWPQWSREKADQLRTLHNPHEYRAN